MTAADQTAFAHEGSLPDPHAGSAIRPVTDPVQGALNQQPGGIYNNRQVDPQTGRPISQNPSDQIPPEGQPMNDLPTTPTGSGGYRTPGVGQLVPSDRQPSDPFDQSTDRGTLELYQTERLKRASSGVPIELPTDPSPGSGPAYFGPRVNPQGQPIGTTVAPPPRMQDPPAGAGNVPTDVQPGQQPLPRVQLKPGQRPDPMDPQSRPQLGDPTQQAKGGNPLPTPQGGDPRQSPEGIAAAQKAAAAAAAGDSLSQLLPLAAVVVVAFLILGHRS